MENVPKAVASNAEVRKPPAVVPEQKSSSPARNTTIIIEHCTRTASAVFFHPETHSELSQAGHTPDVHMVTNAFCWKVKSVVCKIKKKNFQGHPMSIFGKLCSEDDLRSRIFGTFVVKFLACLPLLEFSNI